MSLADHQREGLAIRMLQAGLRPTIVEGVTCLNRKRVLTLRSSLGLSAARGGSMPSSVGICSNAERTLEASLFVKLYSQIASNPDDEVDISALIESHDESVALHKEARRGRINESALLTADDAYVLARDYRQGTVWMEFCGDCRIEFLVSDRQFGRSALVSCPVCVARSAGQRRQVKAEKPEAPVIEFVVQQSDSAVPLEDETVEQSATATSRKHRYG